MTQEYELETGKFGDAIFVMPDGKTYRGKDLADIYVKAIDVRFIVAQWCNWPVDTLGSILGSNTLGFIQMSSLGQTSGYLWEMAFVQVYFEWIISSKN